MLFIIRNLFHGKDFRTSGKGGNLDIVADPEFLFHFFEIIHIFPSQGFIILQAEISFCIILVIDKKIYLSSLDIFL